MPPSHFVPPGPGAGDFEGFHPENVGELTQVGPVRGEPEVVTEHGGGGQPQDDVLAHAFDQVGLGRGVNVDGDA